MSTSIAVNENNDVFTDASGNLAMVTGQDAFAQDCKAVMEGQRGEMVLALTSGIDTLNTIWNDYLPAAFEAQARAELATVPGFVACTAFSITSNNGVASYTASLLSIYSEEVVNISGSLVGP